MLKNQVIYEIKKGERTYTLMFEPGTPAGELFDVLCEIKSFVFDVIKKAQDDEKKQSEQEVK